MMERVVSPPLDELDKLRTPLTEGERLVLEYFLAVLPIRWEIYIQPHLNGLCPDFVLLHPINGIAVFEVKDWDPAAMHYSVQQRGGAPQLMGCKDGKTFSLQKQDPVAKIELYKQEIYNLYCPHLPSKLGFGSIVAGIILTKMDTETAESLLEPLREHHGHTEYARLYPIIGRDLLRKTDESTIKRRILPSLFAVDPRMKDGAAEDLRQWLVEPTFSSEQRRPLANAMTPKQREICVNKTRAKFRRVRGPAGSGKSFVLAGRAAELARDQKKVLIVTYNITLVNYLMDLVVRYTQAGGVRKQIVALNYHSWCKRLAFLAGREDEYKALWTENAGHVLQNALPNAAELWAKELDASQKFDAILVDEGQDFQANWWASLRACLKDPNSGEMMLCADASQNVYGVTQWTDQQMDGAGFRGRWMELETSYRLPPTLCSLAGQFIADFLPNAEGPRPNPPQGQLFGKATLSWNQVLPGEEIERCVAAILEVGADSGSEIAYADRVCLVDDVEIGKQIVSQLRERGIRVSSTFGIGETEQEIEEDSRRKKLRFYKGAPMVKVTTVHSFKGWESRAIIMQISRANDATSLALVYTGITRVRRDDDGCYLTVVNSAQELSDYGHRWGT